jgi:hypothetical protein
MAVPPLLLDLLCQAAKQQKGASACSAGYPDLLVDRKQLVQLLGEDAAARIAVRADSASIARWHGVSSWLHEIFDAASVFSELGYTLDVLDVQIVRGDEVLVDLNLPLPAGFRRSYDLVLDTGTCEHCFHIGQAALNLASLVRQGGFIIQAMPLNSYNHGFYNVNPTWFFDFYPDNGFEIVYFHGVSDVVTNPTLFEPPPFDRFRSAPDNAILVMVARRTRLSALKVPMQRKYRVAPKLGGD